jgi:hypothetical protein
MASPESPPISGRSHLAIHYRSSSERNVYANLIFISRSRIIQYFGIIVALTNLRKLSAYDRWFFSGASVLILVAVFVGFAKTYYLAGIFKAPLPSVIVHIHGAVFSAWVLLLITQTSLVAAKRVDLHRDLGRLGIAIACLMIILGLAAATDSLARKFVDDASAMQSRAFFAVPIADMLVFGTLIYLGFRKRFDKDTHKRLMLLATIALLDAAFVRWPIEVDWWNLRAAQGCCLLLLLSLVGYDLWSRGKIHPYTLWPGLFLLIVGLIRDPIGHTGPWQSFAASVQHLALSLR